MASAVVRSSAQPTAFAPWRAFARAQLRRGGLTRGEHRLRARRRHAARAATTSSKRQRQRRWRGGRGATANAHGALTQIDTERRATFANHSFTPPPPPASKSQICAARGEQRLKRLALVTRLSVSVAASARGLSLLGVSSRQPTGLCRALARTRVSCLALPSATRLGATSRASFCAALDGASTVTTALCGSRSTSSVLRRSSGLGWRSARAASSSVALSKASSRRSRPLETH